MENELSIGFVGFGEAGFHIAKGLSQTTAYDINANTPCPGEKIRRRAGESGTRLVDSNLELARSAEVILSTVTANQAAQAAGQNAPFLNASHIYADLNSVSPGLKQSIARTIEAAGARFVEVAMMGPVPPYGHRVPMLAGGQAAPEFAERPGSQPLLRRGVRVRITGRKFPRHGLAEVGRLHDRPSRSPRRTPCARNGRGRRNAAVHRDRAHHGGSHRAPNGLECTAWLEAAFRR